MKNSQNKIRLLVYDDQEIFRHGMMHILNREVEFDVAALNNIKELLPFVQSNQPDIIMTCVQSNETDIAALISTISQKFPNTAVLAISMFSQEDHIIRMLRAGAKGCLLRSAGRQEVLDAIRTVRAFGYYYSQGITGKLANLVARQELAKFALKKQANLSEKDKSLIQLLCKGLSLKEIARATGLSVYTLQYKKKQIYFRLNTNGLAGLINYAIVNGLYNPYEISC